MASTIEFTVSPIDERVYAKAIDPSAGKVHELMVLASHLRSGEEKVIDLITTDESLAGVLAVVRHCLGSGWGLVETWPPGTKHLLAKAS